MRAILNGIYTTPSAEEHVRISDLDVHFPVSRDSTGMGAGEERMAGYRSGASGWEARLS